MTPEELRAEAADRYYHHPLFHALVELTVELATHEGTQLSAADRDRAVLVASLALVVSGQTLVSLGWAQT